MALLQRIWRDIRAHCWSPKRAIVIGIAFIFIAVGVVGFFIPLFPGIAFALPGLLMLSVYSPSVYGWLKRRTESRPKLRSVVVYSREWLVRHMHPRWKRPRP